MVVKKKNGGVPKKALKKPTAPTNPFEFRKNKERTAVLGKIQSTHAPAGHSRAHAFELRKNTIAVEMEKQEKHNVFIDKREKEQINTKGVSSHELVKIKFDKLIGKAPKERGGIKKKNVYNLADEEVSLPGISLGPKSKNEPEIEAEEEVGQGEEAKDGAKKTNKERFAEIIAKSKYHKYLRQQEKEERENVTEELNEEFKELQEDLYSTKRSRHDKDDENEKKDPNDDYMTLLRTFEFEGRAPATDRSRTTEEVMREENEKLLKLEEDRLKRMLGELKSPSDKAPRAASGDDLEDDFTFGEPLEGEEEDYEDEDDEGEDGGDEDLSPTDAEVLADLLDEERRARAERKRKGIQEDEEEEDVAEEEEEDEGDEEDEEEDEEGEEEADGEEGKTETGEKGEIPFRIEVPENNKAFAKLLEGRSVVDRAIIVDRIMVGSHYTLNRAQNVPKMRLFLRLLWHRFGEVSKFKGVTDGFDAKPVFAELNHVAKYLWELAQQFSDITYNLAKETLGNLFKQFSETEADTTPPLSMQVVAVLQLIGNIFSTTDFQNSVVTPTFTFFGQVLSLAPISNLSHLTRALFLSSLILNWISESHRFVTEPLTLLGALLEQFADPDTDATRYYTFPSLLALDPSFLHFQSKPAKLSPKPLDLTSLSFSDTTTPSDQQRLDILNFVILLTSKYFDTYSDNKSKSNFQDAVPQLFGKIRESLAKIESRELCKSIQDVVKSFLQKIDEKVKEIEKNRKALTLQDSGPVTIQQLEPNYNADYNGRKPKLSELPERVMKHKMRKRVRLEQRKAEKELTRDTQFIAREWAKKRKMEDEATKAHTTKVMVLLEKEAHEKKLDFIRKNPIKAFNQR